MHAISSTADCILMKRHDLKVTDHRMICFYLNDTPWSIGYGPEDDHFLKEITRRDDLKVTDHRMICFYLNATQ